MQIDQISIFIGDALMEKKDGEYDQRVRVLTIYDLYKEWCGKRGEIPRTATAFNLGMRNNGIPKKQVGGLMFYTGICIPSAAT